MSNKLVRSPTGQLALGALLAGAGAAQAGDIPNASRTNNPGAAVGYQDALDAGRAQLKSGRVLEALQAYTQALSRAPDSIEALNAVAVCYDRMGKFDTSRTYYETALGIDPQSPLLLNNYGYSLYLQGERTQATRFLALAVATGDAGVQATALRILAKIEAEGRAAPSRGPAAGATAPAIQQAMAQAPLPVQGQPQIVRTSAHEVRLVMADTAPRPAAKRLPQTLAPAVQPSAPQRVIAPAILAEALGPAAAAILPVVALSAEDDRRIAEAEATAIRHEAVAVAVHAQRQAQALSASQTAAVPAMMQAMIDLALGARPTPVAAVLPADAFAPSRPRLPEAADPEWDLHQLLVATGAPANSSARNKPAPQRAQIAGTVPQRPDLRLATLTTLPAAEPITRKRAFEQPFASDDARLNHFAQRLHGVEEGLAVSEQVAALQALMARAAGA